MIAREQPPEAVRARLLAAAAREPATRPGAWRRRVTISVVLAAVWLAAMMASVGIRHDWRDLPLDAAAAMLAGLLGAAAVASVVGASRGRMMVGAPIAWLAGATVGLMLLLNVLVLGVQPHGPSTVMLSSMDALAATAWRCFVLTGVVAVPLLALLLVPLRGLTLARPALAGACLGLGAASWAHAVVWLHCPIGSAGHTMMGHLLPAVPLMLIGAWAGVFLVRRGQARPEPGPPRA